MAKLAKNMFVVDLSLLDVTSTMITSKFPEKLRREISGRNLKRAIPFVHVMSCEGEMIL